MVLEGKYTRDRSLLVGFILIWKTWKKAIFLTNLRENSENSGNLGKIASFPGKLGEFENSEGKIISLVQSSDKPSLRQMFK